MGKRSFLQVKAVFRVETELAISGFRRGRVKFGFRLRYLNFDDGKGAFAGE